MPLHLAAQAGASVPACSQRRSRQLPDPVLEARRRLDEFCHGPLRSMRRSACEVLWQYLGKADLRHMDQGAVFTTTSRELEHALGCSKRTISYANSDLIRWGLIERPAPDLRGRRCPEWRTYLTPKALALFFDHQAQEVAVPLDKEPNSAESQGAAPPADEEVGAAEPAAPDRGCTVHVRDDLRPLLAVLQPAQIRKVLGVAKRAGVWVQDVMAHRLPAILAARKPLGLIISLIGSGEDWTRPVVGLQASVRDAASKAGLVSIETLEAAAGAFLAANEGRWLARTDRTVLVEVHASGCIDHWRVGKTWQRGEVPRSALPGLMQAVETGRLEFVEANAAAAVFSAGERPDAQREAFVARQRARRAGVTCAK